MNKLAIVGVGKIVKDQHLPSIASTAVFEVCATASRNAQLEGIPAYADIETMLSAEPSIEAVALCMPPQYRYDAARIAIDHGCHVLLEKPPGATVSEVEYLRDRARAKGVCLYATWHSRHAPAVAYCKRILAERTILSGELTWIEDVNKWHPGQEWIWQAGGLGVFDPGINGLSILTEVLAQDLRVTKASLQTPSNKQAPIAAQLQLVSDADFNVNVKMDWRVPVGDQGSERWEMRFVTDIGEVALLDGGSRCECDFDATLDATKQPSEDSHNPYIEYQAIYREFAALIEGKQSLVDLRPLQIVADSFMLANVERVEDFVER